MHPKALAMTKHRQVIAPTSRMFYFQDFLSDCKVHKEKTRNEERSENVRERRDDNLHERGKKKFFLLPFHAFLREQRRRMFRLLLRKYLHNSETFSSTLAAKPPWL
jgi:hypothetical protein